MMGKNHDNKNNPSDGGHAQDELLILRALRKINLANQVDVARDGQQALDAGTFGIFVS